MSILKNNTIQTFEIGKKYLHYSFTTWRAYAIACMRAP